MKILRTLFTAIAAAVLALSLSGAEASPAGTWQWTAHGPQGPVEVTARFEHKDGVLTGTVSARGTEAPLTEGSFKNGTVALTMVREMHGTQFSIKYSGKLSGDSITGFIDRPIPGGEREQVEWKASRVK
jgi:hypothetical protein